MINVPYSPSKPFEEPPLSWKGIRLSDGTRSALFTCPNGHTGSLAKWSIEDDGTVRPSVDCSPNGCNFHDYIRLLEWEDK